MYVTSRKQIKLQRMKNIILLFIVIIFISSCSATHQSTASTQTVDDLYYSPATGVEKSYTKQQEQYQNYLANNDDQYLWMKVHNYYLWNTIDDYNYWYNPNYYFGYNPYYYYYNNFYNNWYWYAPVYFYPAYKNPSIKIGSTSGANITAYKNRIYDNSNGLFNNNIKKGTTTVPSNSSLGQLLRRTFTSSPTINSNNNSFNNNNNSYSNPIRTVTPSAAPAGSVGGHSGGATSSGSSSSGGRGGRGGL